MAGSDIPGERAFRFGRFELLRGQKLLLDSGKPVRLGHRALEILIALTERAGEVVSKAELIALVWPNTYVDEANLRVHVAALRKILGDGATGSRFIVNIAGRGYCFVGPVDRSDATRPEIAPILVSDGVPLPGPPSRILGRDDTIAALMAQVFNRRFVTIVGPGGVGKSTVAIAVADQAARKKGCGVCFVDLSSVDSAAMLPAALGAALGFSILTDDPMKGLAAFLRQKTMLILLDNCEHLIDAIGPLVEGILASSSGISVLTTSREPFRIKEEWAYRLPALATPSTLIGLTAEAALGYPAVELFIERAKSSTDGFEPDDSTVLVVADICGRLDGIPLAIELVAARMDLFSVQALAKGLDNLLLTTKGPRTAQPRQQSLKGALDWSFSLLSNTERTVLTRLAIFRGAFELDSAASVVSGQDITIEDVKRSISSLAAKSLITTDASGPNIRYRLLLVTRVYATEKLHDNGEWAKLVRRHAEHFRDFMNSAQERWMDMARAEWLLEYTYAIDDIRTAMDWAFSSGGDIEMGASLAVGSLPFGFQMSLIDEFKRRVELALAELSRHGNQHTVDEVRLTAAFCTLNLNAIVSSSSLKSAFARVAELSERILLPRDKIEPLLQQAFFLYGSERSCPAAWPGQWMTKRGCFVSFTVSVAGVLVCTGRLSNLPVGSHTAPALFAADHWRLLQACEKLAVKF